MPKQRQSLFRKLTGSLRSNVIAGVLVLAPFGAVFWIMLWLWNMLVSLASLLPMGLHPKALLNIEHPVGAAAIDFITTLVLFGLIVLFVWAVGLISRNYMGKRLIEAFSVMLSRVPVLSTVYSTLEQLLKTFRGGQSKNFRRVVQVEYPRKGLYTLAFVTGERSGLLTIYVPTTPNPTSGFYLSVAENEVKDVGMSVEDALKEIISMGIVHSERK